MAKDVDLSSKEWRDIVFEGKNKEFGAYEMRQESEHRHTRAVVIVLSALVVILALLILSLKGVFSKAEEEGPDAGVEQDMTALVSEEEIIEEEEEEQIQFEQPEEEIIQPEEVANEQRVTELLVVNDEDFEAEKEVKEQDQIKENEAQFGTVDVTEGTNDLNKQTIEKEVLAEAPPAPEPEKVYTIAMVEQKPEFPGGEQAMYKWLSDHINYPAQASEEGVQGRVVVSFDVAKDGAITNVQIARGRHQALDKEAMRLVKSMPRWQPGRNNGQPVKVSYTLPITFKLQQ
ncbi:MAG: energy transducer TonB [Odoribacter sp.]|nr:energy transducer TonB [Odoribacter sp.]